VLAAAQALTVSGVAQAAPGTHRSTHPYAVDLKTENKVDPIGIDERAPLLSWRSAGSPRTVYEIRAAPSADALREGRADVWRTGKVVSSASTGIPFSAALTARTMNGELHAVIHPDVPRITNVGYLVDDGRVFHPGDALTVPDQPVHTLLVPVMAPWSKISEVIDYVREVEPRSTIDVHDALINDLAHPVYSDRIGAFGGAQHLRLEPGQSTTL
jgi:hypothetical protein